MAIELHHLHPSHDDELSRLKLRIAEMEAALDKEKAWSETLSKNGVTMSHEIERLKAENERMKSRIAELERMDTEHTLQIAKMNGYINHLEEERRWRKFPDEKPTEEMEGVDFIVSNGYYSVVCEWRGYWNNDPFCGDRNCDVVKYWKPLPSAPKEEK